MHEIPGQGVDIRVLGPRAVDDIVSVLLERHQPFTANPGAGRFALKPFDGFAIGHDLELLVLQVVVSEPDRPNGGQALFFIRLVLAFVLVH